MNIIRKLGGLLLALALAGVAVPAFAQKTFTLEMTANLGSVPVGSPQSGVIDVINNSPDGNANFNSFKLTAPVGILITAAARTTPQSYAGTVSAPGTDANGRSFITVTYISPSVGKQSRFKVNVTLAGSCGGGGLWSADVRAGSQVNGQVFGPAGTLPSTTSSSCSLAFQTQPANALTNTTITGTSFDPSATAVQVKVTPVVSGVTVALEQSGSCAPGSLTLTGKTASTDANGVATFGNLKSGTWGTDCKLAATSTGYTAATSGTFSVASATLSFQYGPANALSGTVITSTPLNNPPGNFVTALLQVNGGTPPPWFSTVSVSVTSACTVVAGGTASTNALGVASFSNLTITNTSAQPDCTLTASAFGGAVTVVSTGTFGIAPFSPSGKLKCGETAPQADTSAIITGTTLAGLGDPGYASVTRGLHNTKGDPCDSDGVDIQFLNTVVTAPNVATLKWNTFDQPNAAFEVTVNWEAKALPTDGTYPPITRPKVAWEFNPNGTPVTSKTIELLGCLSPLMPAPYATLSVGLTTNPTTVSGIVVDYTVPTLETGTWHSLPVGIKVPVYIGTERMNATRAINGTLTLEREQGMTTAQTHNIGARVMSTPMPIDTRSGSPYINKAVRMCDKADGFVVYGVGMYFQRTTYIDAGDGWIGTEE